VSEKRRGLGRGLGALIPNGLDGQRSSDAQRPVDVFFPDNRPAASDSDLPPDPVTRPVSRGTTTSTAAAAQSADVEASAETSLAQGSVTATDGGAATAEDASLTSHSPEPTGVDGSGEDAAAQRATGASRASNGRGSGPAEDLVPVPGARFAELPVDAIRPNPRQPRTVFEEEALEELVASILEVGVLQPVVVRPVGEDGYELIMGERRWRATQAAGLSVIPAIVRETEDSDLLRDALLENLHRSQLNPLEEAAAYQQLLDDFGCTHEELATRIHRSRPQISNTLRLLRLPPLVQRRVAAGVISAGHARALLGLADGAAIERLAQRIVSEGLSVRAVEEIVSLGGDAEGPAARRRPKAGERNEALDELATRLSDRFETRVKINLGKSRGRLTVEFASVQDLNRILESLAPQDPGLLKP
jgi:ParB family chromosome partitioning protein